MQSFHHRGGRKFNIRDQMLQFRGNQISYMQITSKLGFVPLHGFSKCSCTNAQPFIQSSPIFEFIQILLISNSNLIKIKKKHKRSTGFCDTVIITGRDTGSIKPWLCEAQVQCYDLGMEMKEINSSTYQIEITVPKSAHDGFQCFNFCLNEFFKLAED